jgi:hypothetical protein
MMTSRWEDPGHDGREHCKSFKGRALADGFLTGLKDAARGRRPFNPRTGLPEADTTEEEEMMTQALVIVTTGLTTKEPSALEPRVVRLALAACAKTLAGKPAGGSTQRRKRSVFYNALGDGVELGFLSDLKLFERITMLH